MEKSLNWRARGTVSCAAFIRSYILLGRVQHQL